MTDSTTSPLNWVDTTPPEGVDIAIVIALKEEFVEFVREIQYKTRHFPEFNCTFYFFERAVAETPRGYRCVATFTGEMGPTVAAVVAERMMQLFKPRSIVNIGISASMTTDVVIGDVVLGDVVDEYISSAKAVAEQATSHWCLQLAGRPYTTTREYLVHAEHLQFRMHELFATWQAACTARQTELQKKEWASVVWPNGPSRIPTVLKGHIASGPIVSGSEEYKAVLGRRDRKYVAVDMESAGVMAAAADRDARTLVIRGVSDPGDGSKGNLENLTGGALRVFAMRNAMEYLWMLLDARILIFLAAKQDEPPLPSAGSATQVVRQPIQEIRFDYLPDAIQFHGWMVADGPASIPARCRTIDDHVVGKALGLRGPLEAHVDYYLRQPHPVFKHVDLMFRPTAEPFTIYVQAAIVRNQEKRLTWIIPVLEPRNTQPVGDGQWEWWWRIAPQPIGDNWLYAKIDAVAATQETFGKDGWSLEDITGFRLRGTIDIAAIGLYESGG